MNKMTIVAMTMACPLGVFVRPSPLALCVYKVVPGPGCALKPGDFILSINGKMVSGNTPNWKSLFCGQVAVTAWRPSARWRVRLDK